MHRAIEQARAARVAGEVPVGAVIVRDGEVIAAAHNTTRSDADPTAHAEVLAMREAGRRTGDWRLEGCALIVTLEPCPMCMGAIILARIPLLVYGAPDPRYGACGSAIDLTVRALAPHLEDVRAGVEEATCGALLREFFQGRRQEN